MATDIGAIRYTIEADRSQLVTAGEAVDQFKIESLQAAEATDTFGRAVRTTGTQAQRAGRQVKTYAKATDSVTRTSRAARRGMNGMSSSAGQAGIQIQQLVGQLQGGVAPMTALAQQGADLGIVLGAPLAGVVLSLGAVLAGVLIPGMMDSAKSAEELLEEIDELSDGFRDLTDAQRAYVVAQLEQQIMAQTSAVTELESELERLDARIARNAETAKGQSAIAQQNQREAINNLKEDREERLRVAAEIDNQNQRLGDLRDQLEAVTNDTVGLTDEQSEQTEKLKQLVTQLEREAELIGKSTREKALYEAATLGATDAQLQQINAAFDTIEAFEQQEEASKKLRKEQQEFLSNLLRTMQQEEQARDRRIEQLNREAEAQERARASATEGLVTELMTPAERERERFREQMDVLENAKEQELSIIGGYNQAKERLEQQHADRMAEIESASNDNKWDLLTQGAEARLNATESIFGNLADIAKAGGKESFEAYKQLASAEALVAGSLATLKALASAPPPFNFILAGTVAAATAVQIAQIQSQEYDGARALGGQMQPGNRYLVGENGPEIVSMGGGVPAHVTPNNELGMGGGDINVTNVWQISTGVQETVQAEIQRMGPAIAEQSKKSVMEAINSGGAMAKVVRRRA